MSRLRKTTKLYCVPAEITEEQKRAAVQRALEVRSEGRRMSGKYESADERGFFGRDIVWTEDDVRIMVSEIAWYCQQPCSGETTIVDHPARWGMRVVVEAWRSGINPFPRGLTLLHRASEMGISEILGLEPFDLDDL